MKRHVVIGLILSALFLFLFFFSLFSVIWAQSATDWWHMFRHDSMHTGYSTSTAPNTNQTLWNYTVGDVLSSPAVVDGNVYLGSWDNYVYCLDVSSGNLVWKYLTGDEVWSHPAVADGKVYIGSEDHNFYCLDAFNGGLLWNYTTGNMVTSSAGVVGGRVYFGSDDYNVYCLDAANGNLIWNYTTNNYVRSSPAVADGKVYTGSQDNNIYCLDASNGNLVWKYTTGSMVPSSPGVADGNVYVGSGDGNVYCLDAINGNLIWKYTTGSFVGSSPAVVDSKVYIGSEDDNVYCLDAINGNLIWKYTTGLLVETSPAVADGKVYIGSMDDNVYCLDASNGKLVWKYLVGNIVLSSPAVADGKVFISNGYSVYAFGASETSTGKPRPNTPVTSSSEYVATLYAVPWVPPAREAAAAAAVTATAVGIAATVQASLSNQVGTQTGKVAEKMIDLLPDGFKRWLEEFVSSKRKARVSQKTASALLPTKAEVLAYGVSLLVLTISFSYVKVNDITQVLYVLPAVLVTAAIVEFAKTFSQVVVARSLGVWTEHKLWYFGLVMLLASTFIFGIPFSAPTRNVYYTPKLTKRLNAVVSCMAILVTLAFGALFFGLLVSGFTLIGSTGLAMCIIMGFIDTFPVNPLNGKAIYQHNKAAWAAFFVFTLTIYVSWLLFF